MERMNSTSQPPLVSVIINCYNSERFLKEAIDSVYAQTWARWEIILWDNASTDHTAEIAQSYDSRLRYFRAERNTPLGQARNLAFARATGDFIAMLDSDDVWLPETLEMLVGGMKDDQREYAVCYGGVYRISADGREIGRMIPAARRGNLFPQFLRQFDIIPCASMVRRSILLESGHGFEESLTTSEDVCFFLTLAVDHPFYSLGRPVARYRIHEGALTNRSIGRWADEWEFTIEKIIASRPQVEREHKSAVRHMRARIDYYRARNLMHEGERSAARRVLRRNVGVDVRFFVLFALAMLPAPLWNAAHAWYHKRSQFS